MEPLPNTVEIVEVGPRDGFQSIKTTIATSRKIELIRDLYNSGLRRIEIGSFVSSSAIPQFADITELVEATRSLRELDTQVLVPTERRAIDAIAAGASHLVFVLSVSNTHNRSNVRRSTAESLIEFGHIVSRVPADTRIRVNIATAFDCPYEGHIAPSVTMALLNRLVAMAPTVEIGVCDTTGRAMPDQVEALFSACLKRHKAPTTWAFHGHDTYGMGLTNVLAAWRAGVKIIDASFAGLGGCPFAPGATGNVATEDVIWLFDGLRIQSGVDLRRLIEAAMKAVALPEARCGGRVRDALARQGSLTPVSQ